MTYDPRGLDDFDVHGTGIGRPGYGCFGDKHPLGNPELADAFLDQGDAWASTGGYVRIADMTPQHALNTALFILHRSLQVAVVLRAGGSIVTDGEIAREADRIQMLLARPLLVALLDRAADRPGAQAYPWERALR